MAISQWGEKFFEIVFDNLNHKIFNKTSELFTQLYKIVVYLLLFSNYKDNLTTMCTTIDKITKVVILRS